MDCGARSQDDADPHRTTGRCRILLATSAMFGIAFNWGAQYSRVTPILQELGLPPEWLGVAWFAGPMSGILVQPWVAYQSDRTTHRWGRRRIWILRATIGLAFANLVMAFAPAIAALLGCEGRGNVARAIAIVGFWLSDIFINMVQLPARTLIVDLLSGDQLATGNAYLGLWEGMGKLSAFACGSFPIESMFPQWVEASGAFFANAQIFFLIGNLSMFLSLLTTWFSAREKPMQYLLDDSRDLPGAGHFRLSSVFSMLSKLSPGSKSVWIALCCVNFAWFTSWIYIPAYMGIDVMHGDPTALPGSALELRYRIGADLLASRAQLAQATLSLILVCYFPVVMKRISAILLWVVCECLHAAVYFATPFIRTPWAATANLGIQGVAWAAFLVIPYTLVGREAQHVSEGQEALYMSVMNLALCFPEVLASVLLGPLVATADNESKVAIVMAGCACFLACGVLVKRSLIRSSSEQ